MWVHGGIPVPGMDGTTSDTVEGVWQGLKVIRGQIATRYFRGPWKLMGLMRIFPRALRDWGYDLVARNRYRWFGRVDECMVPTAELRARFIE
jgi:predicted DCC family thiol-disulfide oxidoreductase YuxK